MGFLVIGGYLPYHGDSYKAIFTWAGFFVE
jgi:hypothetical protein